MDNLSRLWVCARCTFTSPHWNTAASFSLCVACDAAEKQRASAARAAETPVEEQHEPATKLRVKILHTTAKALLVHERGANQSRWLPRSGVRGGDQIQVGFVGEIHVAPWLARQLGTATRTEEVRAA